MKDRKDRVSALLDILNIDLYGKRQVMALSLLSAFAGESIFLLGPPGVAKSMIARRLKLAFTEGESFEYLMSRFSTPDEIFGPVSISRLKEEDAYERLTCGYLPEATVVFLDEIWKAGPAIQNALLTVLNEKIFRNGSKVCRLPLKALVAASNELPMSGQGLDALWDRFLIRMLVGGIEDLSDFDRMIASVGGEEPEMPAGLGVTNEEYERWQQEIALVEIPYPVFEIIHSIKEQIEDYNKSLLNADVTGVSLYVSDRRWKKWVKLLRTSAFLNGSNVIRLSDCMLLSYGLWNETEQMTVVADMVREAVRRSIEGYVLNIREIKQELDDLRHEFSADATVRENSADGLQLVDSYYYQVERVRMAEKLWMFASDYQQLDDAGQLFYLHKDKYKSQCYILKKYNPSLHARVPKSKVYSLRKGRRSVFINNYEYPMLCTPDALPLPTMEVSVKADLGARFVKAEQLIERVEHGCTEFLSEEIDYCTAHLFLSDSQKQTLHGMLVKQQTDVSRYRNELNELKHAYHKENQEYSAG